MLPGTMDTCLKLLCRCTVGGLQMSAVAAVPVCSLAALGAVAFVGLVGEQVVAAVVIAVRLAKRVAAGRGAVILEDLLPLPPNLLEEEQSMQPLAWILPTPFVAAERNAGAIAHTLSRLAVAVTRLIRYA